MKFVLVHGFNVRDGGTCTIDRLAPYFEKAGHTVDVDEADYGYYNLLDVRFRKHRAVVRIAEALKDADVIVSHSNGADYENKALKLLERRPKKYKVIRLSPAMNRGAYLPKNVEKCWVFHTRSDFPVWISALLILHPWGRMGQKGYKGQDLRFSNVDYTNAIKKHSGWFADHNRGLVASDILTLV